MDSVHKLDISDKEKERVSNEILERTDDLFNMKEKQLIVQKTLIFVF